jgi:hypothetical protein
MTDFRHAKEMPAPCWHFLANMLHKSIVECEAMGLRNETMSAEGVLDSTSESQGCHGCSLGHNLKRTGGDDWRGVCADAVTRLRNGMAFGGMWHGGGARDPSQPASRDGVSGLT